MSALPEPNLPMTADKQAEAIANAGDRIIDKLRLVHDPEIPVNIFDLGLIYKIDVNPREDGKFDVVIDMTLTTPNCPVAGTMPGLTQMAVQSADGIGDVKVNLVWEPPWDKSRMTDEARMTLNMF
jgi:FeS assembly SUF system protein